MTQADVEDANSVGAPAGSFVLWIKAEDVAATAKTFTLKTANTQLTTITVNFTDTSLPVISLNIPTAFSVPENGYDVFAVNLLAGQTYNIFTSESTGDPYIYLFEDEELTNPLVENDDGDGTSESMIEFTPSTSATYYIVVEEYDYASFSGSLTVTDQGL